MEENMDQEPPGPPETPPPSEPPPLPPASPVDDWRLSELQEGLASLRAEVEALKELGRPEPPAQAADDGRIAELQEWLGSLRAEIEALQANAPAGPQARAEGGDEYVFRLERVEALVQELRQEFSAADEASRARLEKTPAREEVGALALRVADLAGAMDSLKRTFAREGELSARLAQAEGAISSMRTNSDGQGLRLKAELDTFASKDAVDELRVSLSSAAVSLEEMKLGMAQYSEELYSLGRECRKSLGEAQGLAKAAARLQEASPFADFMKEAAAAMNSRLADVEVSLHSGMSELSARVTAVETLCGKVLASAEERLRKAFEPKLKDLEGQISALRDNLLRLNDDYSVVADRRIRALEAKYSAFEAMARRMEAVDLLLKKEKS